jgi:FkbM family methyltransferase
MTLSQLRVLRGRIARNVFRAVPPRAVARRLARSSSRVAERLGNVPVDGQVNVQVTRRTSFRYLASASNPFVDIGSFTGTYTLAACAVNSHLRCFAFEPVPHVYKRLSTNIALNGWTHRVTAVHAAVSGTCGAERFWLPDRAFPDTGHFSSSARVDLEPGGSWQEVPTTAFSAALLEGAKVGLIKSMRRMLKVQSCRASLMSSHVTAGRCDRDAGVR